MVLAPAVVRRFAHEREAGLLVEMMRGDEGFLGPERYGAALRFSGEAQALGDERLAYAATLRPARDEEKAQLCDRGGPPHQCDRADRLAVDLGDP
jgi:hypothetical protein